MTNNPVEINVFNMFALVASGKLRIKSYLALEEIQQSGGRFHNGEKQRANNTARKEETGPGCNSTILINQLARKSRTLERQIKSGG